MLQQPKTPGTKSEAETNATPPKTIITETAPLIAAPIMLATFYEATNIMSFRTECFNWNTLMKKGAILTPAQKAMAHLYDNHDYWSSKLSFVSWAPYALPALALFPGAVDNFTNDLDEVGELASRAKLKDETKTYERTVGLKSKILPWAVTALLIALILFVFGAIMVLTGGFGALVPLAILLSSKAFAGAVGAVILGIIVGGTYWARAGQALTSAISGFFYKIRSSLSLNMIPDDKTTQKKMCKSLGLYYRQWIPSWLNKIRIKFASGDTDPSAKAWIKKEDGTTDIFLKTRTYRGTLSIIGLALGMAIGFVILGPIGMIIFGFLGYRLGKFVGETFSIFNREKRKEHLEALTYSFNTDPKANIDQVVYERWQYLTYKLQSRTYLGFLSQQYPLLGAFSKWCKKACGYKQVTKWIWPVNHLASLILTVLPIGLVFNSSKSFISKWSWPFKYTFGIVISIGSGLIANTLLVATTTIFAVFDLSKRVLSEIAGLLWGLITGIGALFGFGKYQVDVNTSIFGDNIKIHFHSVILPNLGKFFSSYNLWNLVKNAQPNDTFGKISKIYQNHGTFYALGYVLLSVLLLPFKFCQTVFNFICCFNIFEGLTYSQEGTLLQREQNDLAFALNSYAVAKDHSTKTLPQTSPPSEVTAESKAAAQLSAIAEKDGKATGATVSPPSLVSLASQPENMTDIDKGLKSFYVKKLCEFYQEHRRLSGQEEIEDMENDIYLANKYDYDYCQRAGVNFAISKS